MTVKEKTSAIQISDGVTISTLYRERALMCYEWSLKKHCIRWVTLRYDEFQKAPPYEKW